MPRYVTLGGLPLLASSDIAWNTRPGVLPTTQVFDVEPGIAHKLTSQGIPVDLAIMTDDGYEQKITNLWVLSEAPRSDPYIARIRVADRRWFWQYGHTLRRFNKRRRVGYYRISAWDVLELQRVEDDIQYAPYSLDGGIPYTPVRMIDETLGAALSVEQTHTGNEVPYMIDESVAVAMSSTARLENIELDDRADSALARLLREIPAADVSVRADGTIIVYSRANKMDAAAVAQITDAGVLTEGGWMTPVSYRQETPEAIDVLFTLEPEVRFDFFQRDSTDTTPDGGDSAREMDNVVSNPDYQVTVGGVVYPQNTYLTFGEWLPAISGNPTLYGATITDETIRRAIMPFMDLWAAFAEVGQLDPEADWSARISAIQSHWRRLFRIRRQWVDALLGIKAYTVGTVNQATGGRAPALAFADYFKIGAQKSHAVNYSETGDAGQLAWGHNVYGWADNISAETRPIPAHVTVADSDQGIIDVAYLTDPYRMTEMLLPGTIEAGTIPGWRGSEGRETPVTFNSLRSADADEPKLEEEWKLSVVVTAIPASPNDERQLFRLRVMPQDVSQYPDAQRAAEEAFGPIQEIRVPAQVETARVRWSDDRADAIESIFGLGSLTDRDTIVQQITPLIVNLENGGQVGPGGSSVGASLTNIARSVAARVWASYAKHPAGSVTGDLRSKVFPVGWIDSVEHRVATDGRATTTVMVPERYPELDWTTILDDATRATVMRQVYSQ